MSEFFIERFYNNQSVQRSYHFTVDFDMVEVFTGNSTLDKFNNDSTSPIKHHHVKNIIFPYTIFKKEVQPMGIFNKQFAVLDDNGYELKIELQEDAQTNVAQFILYLQKRIMNSDGTYNPINKSKININVSMYNYNGEEVARYKFNHCMFMNATEPNYTYDTSTAISQVLTFSAEEMIIAKESPTINIDGAPNFTTQRGRGGGRNG